MESREARINEYVLQLVSCGIKRRNLLALTREGCAADATQAEVDAALAMARETVVW